MLLLFVWEFNPLLLIEFLFNLFSPGSKTFSFREGGLLSHTQYGFHPSFWDGAPTSGNLWFRNRWNYGSWPTQQALFVPDSKRLSENMMIFMGDGKIRRRRYEYLWFKKRENTGQIHHFCFVVLLKMFQVVLICFWKEISLLTGHILQTQLSFNHFRDIERLLIWWLLNWMINSHRKTCE